VILWCGLLADLAQLILEIDVLLVQVAVLLQEVDVGALGLCEMILDASGFALFGLDLLEHPFELESIEPVCVLAFFDQTVVFENPLLELGLHQLERAFELGILFLAREELAGELIEFDLVGVVVLPIAHQKVLSGKLFPFGQPGLEVLDLFFELLPVRGRQMRSRGFGGWWGHCPGRHIGHRLRFNGGGREL